MKRLFSDVLLILLAIASIIPFVYTRFTYRYPSSNTPTVNALYNKNTYQFHYDKLSDKEKKVYDEYVEAFLHLDKKIMLKERLTINEEKNVFEAVSHDHPDFYYLPQRKCRYSYITKKIDLCEFLYPYSTKEIKKYNVILDNKINNIISEAEKLDNDYEKVKYIHDVIIDIGEYDDNVNNDDFRTMNDYQSIVSILTTGKSVCSGYSKLFQILANKLDIKATSFYDNDYISSGDGHIWNAVYVNNNWYYVDVTWDDNDYDKYFYFLKNYDTFYRTHTVINENLK